MPIVVELSMVGIAQIFIKNGELNYDLLLISASVMLANILTYYVFIKINNDLDRETEFNALQQKYEYDKQHSRDIEELYSKTCGLRHDLLNHFTTISGLLGEDNIKANEYIQSVLQNQLKEIKSLVKSDNECFDAIANAKIALCESLGIDVQTRIMNHSLDRLKRDEIGIIFGNLFDNAIEASKDSKKKAIELEVQIQGSYLSIFMKNSIDTSVLDKNKNLETDKPNKLHHGFGTKNIKRIVDEYGGMINYFEDDGYFGCDILI